MVAGAKLRVHGRPRSAWRRGEAIITGMTAAIDRHVPFIIFTASGGARMQEGIFSLMQMPRTTLLVQRLRAAKLPYIVVLTNPTDGRRHRLLRHAGRHPHRRAPAP